jgi:Rieske Fe-S protein
LPKTRALVSEKVLILIGAGDGATRAAAGVIKAPRIMAPPADVAIAAAADEIDIESDGELAIAETAVATTFVSEIDVADDIDDVDTAEVLVGSATRSVVGDSMTEDLVAAGSTALALAASVVLATVCNVVGATPWIAVMEPAPRPVGQST